MLCPRSYSDDIVTNDAVASGGPVGTAAEERAPESDGDAASRVRQRREWSPAPVRRPVRPGWTDSRAGRSPHTEGGGTASERPHVCARATRSLADRQRALDGGVLGPRDTPAAARACSRRSPGGVRRVGVTSNRAAFPRHVESPDTPTIRACSGRQRTRVASSTWVARRSPGRGRQCIRRSTRIGRRYRSSGRRAQYQPAGAFSTPASGTGPVTVFQRSQRVRRRCLDTAADVPSAEISVAEVPARSCRSADESGYEPTPRPARR